MSEYPSYDVIEMVGKHVERIRKSEVDDAKALLEVLETAGSVTELNVSLLPIRQIDKYRVDLDMYYRGSEYVKAPSDKGWSDSLTPVDFYMAMILEEGDYEFKLYPDAYDIIQTLLDAGSCPVSGHGIDRTFGSEFDDDPGGKKKYDRIVKLLKPRRDKPKREKTLAMSKMLSDRLGAESSAATAGNIMDVLYLVSEALAGVESPPETVKHWIPSVPITLYTS